MKVVLPLPLFGFVVGTRAAFGLGVGLLVAGKLSEPRRRALGLALVGLGVATTIPAIVSVRGRLSRGKADQGAGATGCDKKLVGVERFPRKGDDENE